MPQPEPRGCHIRDVQSQIGHWNFHPFLSSSISKAPLLHPISGGPKALGKERTENLPYVQHFERTQVCWSCAYP